MIQRTVTALLLAFPAFLLIFYTPHAVVRAVMAALAYACWREFGGLAAGHNLPRPGQLPLLLGFGLMVVPVALLAPVLVLAVLSLLVASLSEGDLRRCLPRAAVALLGIAYIFGAWRCGAELHVLNPHWLMAALIVNWIGDSMALFAGRAFGRHKLAPVISPAKSWEGAVSSWLFSVAAVGLYLHWAVGAQWPLAVGVPAVANLAGQTGDLCESALKRGAGVKDSGSILPGHGGWLDRLDSTLFSLPAVYAVLMVAQALRTV